MIEKPSPEMVKETGKLTIGGGVAGLVIWHLIQIQNTMTGIQADIKLLVKALVEVVAK